MTLFGEYLTNTQRRIFKWHQYFPIYEWHFERFKNRHVTVFEIGVGEGGSLQQWRRYLGPFATIVGLDHAPICQQVEEDQIYVRVGKQDDTSFLARVCEEFGPPDIVIDDGSHIMTHINATFAYLYPRVSKNGVYLVEDLHAAYWPDHGGGLHHPDSFIERAKSYVDELHAEYSGGTVPRTALGDRTTSIHFYDSVIVFEVGEYRPKRHSNTGNPDLFRSDWTPEARNVPPPSAPAVKEAPEAASREALLAQLRAMEQHIGRLEAEVAALRSSTSWRITSPLRRAARLVGAG
jgi:hypothetical protein